MTEYIENQPVFLGTTNTCSNDSEFVYNQLVDVTDTTQFQLRIEPCISAEQIIVNPIFELTEFQVCFYTFRVRSHNTIELIYQINTLFPVAAGIS